MTMDVVIDETGEIISVQRFVMERPWNAPAGFASGSPEQEVCRLGLALVRPLRLGLQVFVHRERLATASLVRLAYLISDNAKSVTVLSTWDSGSFKHTIVGRPDRAIFLLSNLAPGYPDNYQGPMSRRTIDRNCLPSQLQQSVDAWIDGGGCADVKLLPDIVQRLTNDRFVAFEKNQGSLRFTLHSFGQNNPSHALRWYEGNLGKPLRSNDLDLAYHWFCNNAYRDALALQHPLCELVEARVRLPSGQLMDRRYHRIILPVRGNCSQLVLVATKPHSGN